MLKQLKSKKITPAQVFKSCLENISIKNPINNAYVETIPKHINEEMVKISNYNLENNKARRLEGLTIAVKDNFCIKGYNTTAGSKMLENFVAPYDATVVHKLKENGAILMGKTNMDEFGMGSYNVHSYFGPVKNPLHEKRCAGGSSGGSAAAVAADMCNVAIGSDTGGSIRLPAAYCGVIGIKPAYGHVSRWGLIPYANSLDTPGILCKGIIEGMEVLNCIDGYDEKDSTSIPSIKTNEINNDIDLLEKYTKNIISGNSDDKLLCLNDITVGIPKEYYVKELPEDILKTWKNGIKILDSYGANIVEVSLPTVKHALPAYYIIALAEAASNLAKYDGVRYGYRDQNDPPDGVYTNTRSIGFGNAVKERIMMGNLVLGAGSRQLYEHASKTRNKLVNEFDNVFTNECDVMLSPTSCNIAPLIEDIVNGNKKNTNDDIEDPTLEYIDDIFTIPASLVGIPSFAIPIYNDNKDFSSSSSSSNKNSLPYSLQVMGKTINCCDVGGGIGEKQLKVALVLENWGKKK